LRPTGGANPRALLLVGLLVIAGATIMLAHPRHRALDVGGGPRAAFSAPSAPGSPAPAAGAASPAPSAAPRAGSPAATAVRIPEPDGAGHVRVPVTDVVPARVPAGGVPTGWEKIEFAGHDPSIELIRDGRLALRLRSDRNSFAVHRDLVLDVRQYPILTWSWKVARLPTGGDVRDPKHDDQAAQVYVVFPRWPAPRTSSAVIGYVWDTGAPVGTSIHHPRAPNVRIIVLESGPGRLDTWLREQRNVAEDYKTLFGGQPPRAGKVALMIDSNDTKSTAEALFGDLTFSRLPVSSQ
jgi:Protein of unknown function (DUF3047)